MRRLPIAILASGSGSNAQAIIDRAASGALPVEVACVVSDRPAAPALERARRAGIDAIGIDAKALGRDGFEETVVAELRERGVRLVVLAGFMRICGPVFLDAFEGSTVNVHPSMLPAFPGADAIGAALRARVPVTGVTVHWIDAGVDTGPVIAQAPVPIHPNDDRERLQARIQRVEHVLLPLVVGRIAQALLDRPVAAAGLPARQPVSRAPHHLNLPATTAPSTASPTLAGTHA
jgi:phosphoribosylglycinamide formyltransferase-1